jgi:hypothetical protein
LKKHPLARRSFQENAPATARQNSIAMQMLKIFACVLLVAMALGSAESAQPMCYTPEV